MTREEIDQYFKLQEVLVTAGKTIGQTMGIDTFTTSLRVKDVDYVFLSWFSPEYHSQTFPIAVLYDADIRAAEVDKWKAENDTEYRERAEYERLKAKYENS